MSERSMRIAIVTLFTGEISDFGEIGAANKQAYARRHGYDCFVYRERLDATRQPAWSKLEAIKKHLPDYDWVFWTDADSLIMNDEQTLESIISGHEHMDMIVTWEIGYSPVNLGQWLVRSSTWSAETLSVIGEVAWSKSGPEGWFEQAALVEWLGIDEMRWSHLAVLHPRVMNSTPEADWFGPFNKTSLYQHNDFIIHFWPLSRRREAIFEMMTRYDALLRCRPLAPGALCGPVQTNAIPHPKMSWLDIKARVENYRRLIRRGLRLNRIISSSTGAAGLRRDR
jgi:mannan polymerase II complex MNN10 subunit